MVCLALRILDVQVRRMVNSSAVVCVLLMTAAGRECNCVFNPTAGCTWSGACFVTVSNSTLEAAVHASYLGLFKDLWSIFF